MPQDSISMKDVSLESKQVQDTAEIIRQENLARPASCRQQDLAMPADARQNLASQFVHELSTGSSLRDSSLGASLSIAHSYGGDLAVRELVRQINLSMPGKELTVRKDPELEANAKRPPFRIESADAAKDKEDHFGLLFARQIELKDKATGRIERDKTECWGEKPALDPEARANFAHSILRDIKRGGDLQNSIIGPSYDLAISMGGRRAAQELTDRIRMELPAGQNIEYKENGSVILNGKRVFSIE